MYINWISAFGRNLYVFFYQFCFLLILLVFRYYPFIHQVFTVHGPRFTVHGLKTQPEGLRNRDIYDAINVHYIIPNSRAWVQWMSVEGTACILPTVTNTGKTNELPTSYAKENQRWQFQNINQSFYCVYCLLVRAVGLLSVGLN